MAEARSAVAEPRVHDFREGKNAWKDLALGWRYSVVRSFYRTRLISWSFHFVITAIKSAHFGFVRWIC